MKFEKAEIAIIKINANDIVTASGDPVCMDPNPEALE